MPSAVPMPSQSKVHGMLQRAETCQTIPDLIGPGVNSKHKHGDTARKYPVQHYS